MKTKVVVAVIEKDEKILFGRKAPGVRPYPDTWHLIGGKVAAEETVDDAIRREVKEETNLEIVKMEQRDIGEDIVENKHGTMTHFTYLVYHITAFTGEPKPGGDIQKLEWFEKNNLPVAELNKPTITYFRKIGLLP